MDITRPPLSGYLIVKYGFELRKTCPNYWRKKVLPAYCHFKVEEGPSTADLVDVGCDAEVAQLTCRDRDMQVDF